MKERIKAIRAHFALTQEQFAKRINKTSSFISTVETGRCGLSEETVETICRVFGVKEAYLRDGIGEMLLTPSAAIDKSLIGGRIKEVRRRTKLSQQAFADQIGFHKNQVYNVETGKSIPSEEFISAVALKCRIRASWIRTGEGEMTAPQNLVDEKLIEWLRNNPEVARELRVRSGLD